MIRPCAYANRTIVATILFLTGCASPREHLYTLDTAVAEAPPPSTERATVVVAPISLPDVVDRPQLVFREGSNQLIVIEQERWAASLRESIPRVLASQLTQKLPERRFVLAASAAMATPTARLTIDLGRVDLIRGEGARLTAHWVYRTTSPAAQIFEGDVTGAANYTGKASSGYAEALRSACVALADALALQLTQK